MRSPDELASAFRASGRKLTPQRIAVFEVLSGCSHHPTAEAIWEEVRPRMGSISLKTVYQTLHELVELDEILALDLGTGSLRFDPNTQVHDHVVCDRCGRVADVERSVEVVMPPGLDEAGFVAERAEVVYRGLCRRCRRGSDAEVGTSTETDVGRGLVEEPA